MMKKIVFVLYFPLLFVGAGAQQSLKKVSENYFRSPPFEREFNLVLKHLMNDPTLSNKNILKKTDSTLFFLEGDYSNHNPFFFKATRTRIILAEQELNPLDSLPASSLFVYQLIGYASKGEEGFKDVREEFDKFCKKNRISFAGEQVRNIMNGTEVTGNIQDFRVSSMNFFPLTAAWMGSPNGGENLFAVTIRFIVVENEAWLPIPPD